MTASSIKMTRAKGHRTKHLDSEQRFRVRVLFFDAGLTKKRIEEITGYTGSQIRTAISAKSHLVGVRSGRPGKDEIRRRNELQQQELQQEQLQQQSGLEVGPSALIPTQTSPPQSLPGFIPAPPIDTPVNGQPHQVQQAVHQDAQPVVNPSEYRAENDAQEGQAQANTLNQDSLPRLFPLSASTDTPGIPGGSLPAAGFTSGEGNEVKHLSPPPSPSIDSGDITEEELSAPAFISPAVGTLAAADEKSVEAISNTTATNTSG